MRVFVIEKIWRSSHGKSKERDSRRTSFRDAAADPRPRGENDRLVQAGVRAQEASRAVGPDGKILHAEVRIGNSPIMVNDVMMGAKSSQALGGSPASFWIYVEDCDTLYKRAVAAGAQPADGPMGQMQDQFWGDRCGTVTDPEGFKWTIATRKEDLTPNELRQRQDEWMRGFAATTQR